jgi:hypothetical protein
MWGLRRGTAILDREADHSSELVQDQVDVAVSVGDILSFNPATTTAAATATTMGTTRGFSREDGTHGF